MGVVSNPASGTWGPSRRVSAVAGNLGSEAGGAGRGALCADPALLSSLPQDRSLAGKLEPVSPPSPPHADPELELVPPRLSKEELIQNMDRVDREITMVEQQISKLKKKQVRALGEGGPPGAPGTGVGACAEPAHLPARVLALPFPG